MEEIRIFSPTAILGYGFPTTSFETGLKLKPNIIAVDAGSTDPGPYYLGAGLPFTSREAVKRDLKFILKGAYSLNIPVLIGTAGGAGARPHVKWFLKIVDEIIEEERTKFKKSIIYSDVRKKYLSDKLKAGKISKTTVEPNLTNRDILETKRMVAQVGVEPFIDALNKGSNLIIAGRTLDIAEFAAFPIWKGFSKGLSLHLGKILECGAIACEPGSGKDCLFGILKKDHFLVFPTNSDRRCTKLSVSAHSLYENRDPFKVWTTDGYVDLSGIDYEQIDKQTVKVSGSKFIASSKIHLKIEGARFVGYRFISIAGVRDPNFISSYKKIGYEVKNQLINNFPKIESGKDYFVRFINYGIDGVMNIPLHDSANEIGVIMEVVARDKKLAETLLAFIRSTLLHIGYEGRKTTSGNLAILFSPSDFDGGKVYEFSVHHLVEVSSEKEIYKIF